MASRLLARSVFVATLSMTLVTARGACATELPPRPIDVPSYHDAAGLDVTYKTVKLRKIAHKCLGVGRSKDVEKPFALGPLNAVLKWRQPWRWHESRLDRLSPHGLRGGPLVSLSLPLASWASVEAQLGSYRYLYAHADQDPQLGAFCGGIGRGRRSVEAVLFINLDIDILL